MDRPAPTKLFPPDKRRDGDTIYPSGGQIWVWRYGKWNLWYSPGFGFNDV